MTRICSFLLCWIPVLVFGQDGLLQGRLVSGDEHAVPFAKVYNKSCAKGVITNEDGYFSVPSDFVSDTLLITCFGFRPKELVVNSDRFLLINLTENVQLVEEVHASAKSHEALYQLLECADKKQHWENRHSKAYFELRTYTDGDLLELIQSYFNAESNGYDLRELALKEGRIALQPFRSTNFVSLESSRALAMMQLFGENEYYPLLPTSLRGKKLRKAFRLLPESEWMDADSNLISVVRYLPANEEIDGFSGMIWFDKKRCEVLKITMHIDDAQHHPFLPLFPDDTIEQVGLTITKTFERQPKGMRLNHIDFQYTINYKSRSGNLYAEDEVRDHANQRYQVKTKAVLYFYDYGNVFELPGFEFPNQDIGDYRKITGLPYNDFFWEWNDEYTVQESADQNALFFKNSEQSTRESFVILSGDEYRNLFEKSYTHWSENRILFREEQLTESAARSVRTEMNANKYNFNFQPSNANKYNLDFQLYADVNTYGDSTNILTMTICDPYDSYYLLPLDSLAHCFINIYFDVMETKRRELDEQMHLAVSKGQDPMTVYASFKVELELFQTAFLKEMQRGTNTRALLKWNAYVLEKLKIDNIAIFGVVVE